MQRWMRLTLKALAAVLALVVLCIALLVWAVNARRYEPVGGGWYSARDMVELAESGRKPRYLVRGHLPFFRRDVAQSITGIRYLGDDCVAYTFVGQGRDELYAACGEHPPILLDHVDDYRNISIDADPFALHGKSVSVAEIKRRATQH